MWKKIVEKEPWPDYKAFFAELGRPTATPHKQLKLHNKSIMRRGCCEKCRRAKGEYAEVKVD